ncbi:MAG: hypothetical protein WCA85_14085 [Paraburkholderia sp.]|uniref:hypothetical protein n=1 Tax=Paraburkholderia sp. TaxID=1926495 RepID=UPI003C32A0B1
MKIALRRNQVVLPILVTACASICTPPLADAAGRGGGHIERGGGGGGHGGGGGARGGGPGGGGARLNDSHADNRTRNVRNTSVNNVNVNRNVNVNANNNHHGGNDYHHGGWDNDYHPIATAAAVTATVAVTSAIVGSVVRSVPPNCVPVNYGGMIYQQCGGSWYQPQGAQYVVVNAPY